MCKIYQRFEITNMDYTNWLLLQKEKILSWIHESQTLQLFNCSGGKKILVSGAGTAYPSGAPQFTPGFSGVRVARSLVLCVCFVARCLSFCSFGHFFFISPSIYVFWLPLWYPQTPLKSGGLKSESSDMARQTSKDCFNTFCIKERIAFEYT
jgi:hypothetical protein